MHSIEPYFLWRDYYTSSEDEDSPFFNREYSEFYFSKKVYNYYIHPQWDDFGSETLYLKILFADYDKKYVIIELIGEWNDTLENDIATLKDNVINPLLEKGINSFILIGENVFNFHGSDDCYYEEWVDEVDECGGFICFVNFLPHVFDEMEHHDINHHVYLGSVFSGIPWRPMKPNHFYLAVKKQIDAFENEDRFQLEY
jgi:hypothetical protein